MGETTHRFAAVLAADVARFSSRMEDDAEGTVSALQNCRRQFQRVVQRHHGREFGSVGDSLMAEFASPVEALRAAREFQSLPKISEAGASDGIGLQVRIGLHAGDVVVDDGDVFGDVVNTAARLQSLARPGGIALSGFFHYQVRKEAGVFFRSLGTHNLKNISEPVSVYEVATRQRRVNWRRLRLAAQPFRTTIAATLGVIVAGALLITYQEHREATGIAGTISVPGSAPAIAVLPLVSFADDPELEAQADILTDVLTRDLGIVEEFRVRSRTSTMRYRDTDMALPDIARELNADALLEGSVRQVNGRLRVGLQLVDGHTDTLLWSASYDRELGEFFILSSEVTRAIAEALSIVLAPDVEQRLASNRVVSPEAVRFWIIGNDYLKQTDPESFQKALEAYNEAVTRDPDFAEGYAGIALAHAHNSTWHGLGTFDESMPLAREAAKRAIELDPYLPDAHYALALVSKHEWNWEGAERAFRNAARLAATDSVGLVEFANFLTSMGRGDEAMEFAARALELDPNSPVNYNEMGYALQFSGQTDAALEQYLEALLIDPDFGQTHGCLAGLYLEAGQVEKAMPHLEQLSINIDQYAPNWSGLLGLYYAIAGRPDKTHELLEAVTLRSESEPVSSMTFVYFHLGLGNYEEAIRWLEAAHDERDISLIWLKRFWFYDALREDVRFQDIVTQMRFPE